MIGPVELPRGCMTCLFRIGDVGRPLEWRCGRDGGMRCSVVLTFPGGACDPVEFHGWYPRSAAVGQVQPVQLGQLEEQRPPVPRYGVWEAAGEFMFGRLLTRWLGPPRGRP